MPVFLFVIDNIQLRLLENNVIINTIKTVKGISIMKLTFKSRLLSFLLAVVMMLTVLPVSVFAAEDTVFFAEDDEDGDTIVGDTVGGTEETTVTTEETLPDDDYIMSDDSDDDIIEDEPDGPNAPDDPEETTATAEDSDTTTAPEETTGPEEELPDAPEDAEPFAVDSAAGLEAALANGKTCIFITADFEIDRTFYITRSTLIYTTEPRTLTRAADFAGDMFVIGAASDGTLCENPVTLVFGDKTSETCDLFTINGNSENMTVDVSGSVFFVCTDNCVDLYENVTVTNCKKVANARTIDNAQTPSYPDRIGGAVAIIAAGGFMNIYGGKYTNNTVNDLDNTLEDSAKTPSSQGGAFYNYGTLNIYGGLFDSNHAARGSVFYNYRRLNIYSAKITNNSSSDLGGVIYVPNSGSAFLNVGTDNDIVEPSVNFEGNSSGSHGGAIYANNVVAIKNATFKNNSSAKSGGAIVAYNPQITVDNCVFDGNVSNTSGGAISINAANGKEEIREVVVTNSTFTENTAATNGGAVYSGKSARAYFENVKFNSNVANSGGAVYATVTDVEINGAEFKANKSDSNGGAIAMLTSGDDLLENLTTTVTLNDVTADGNTAANGGFIYSENAVLKLYSSTLKSNSTTSTGGAIAFQKGSVAKIYATVFENNTSVKNGGAAMLYTGGTEVLFHSCTFKGNSAPTAQGGAIYASNKSVAKIYCVNAIGNSADKGGFLYQTTTDTTIDIIGATVSGNTATTGGPTVWGNSKGAVLNIDKGKYIDLDNAGDWDSDYWAATIYNSLKVYEVSETVPKYKDYYGVTVTPVVPVADANVKSAAQLERALAAGHSKIYVQADFAIDRTYYITKDVTLISPEAHTLTRAADFAGDMFVIGAASDGTLCEVPVTLTLGDKTSETCDLFTINGNSENMTVDVSGSVFFVCTDNCVDLYENVTVTNCKKVANARTIDNAQTPSYPDRIGGAVAIIAAGGFMNIYGGKYTNNTVNDLDNTLEDSATTPSSQGGAFYNYGTLNIYGGLFDSNHAARGGVFYNYRRLNIYAAEITNNSSSDLGGVIYMPNSGSAFLNVGTDNDLVEPKVNFKGNSAVNHAGVLYARNVIVIKNATFEQNSTLKSGGVIAAYNADLTIDSCEFISNSAAARGGVIMLDGENGKGTKELTVTDTKFTGNTAGSYGGALYMTELCEAYLTSVSFASNAASNGGAAYLSGGNIEISRAKMNGNTSTASGGAVELCESATARLHHIIADGNSAATTGGFIYATASTLDLYNSVIKNNSATVNGGALAFYADATSYVYSTAFENNTSVKNGGAIILYTGGTEVVMHSCSFTGNSAVGTFGGAIYASNMSIAKLYSVTAKNNSAGKGGFLYETTTGTVIDIADATLSGNTATDGGSVIWGNSAGAVLNIDKSKFTLSDVTGTIDWAEVIVNKLKVNEADITVPAAVDYCDEDIDGLENAVSVTSAKELEAALNAGETLIRIDADIEVDRTFYVTGNVTIFSANPYALVRADDFGGDIFVVGESKDGVSALLMKGPANLTLGNPASKTENLLIIDGNKEDMTVPVSGTVFFICGSGVVNLYNNVTVTDCYKNSNERVFEEKYFFGTENRIGGAMAIVESGTLDIYGGNYNNCAVNAEFVSEDGSDDGMNSTRGGLIYNYANLRIYGGNFEYNRASRGGIVYNYRVVYIYGGNFTNNKATTAGGVAFAPSSAGSHLVIGDYAGESDSKVIFANNTSLGSAGVIYSSALSALVIRGNAEFTGNRAIGGSGGAILTYGQLTAKNIPFVNNSAAYRGGAVCATKANSEYITRFVSFTDCTFTGNVAANGGAIALYASVADAAEGAIVTLENCTLSDNFATSNGGAFYAARKSSLTVKDSTVTSNTAGTEGGAMYLSFEAKANVSGTDFTHNSVAEGGKHGGTFVVRSSTLNADGISVSETSSGANGGAVYVSYNSSTPVNSDVTFTNSEFNSSSAAGYGGAIYVTRQDVENEKRILTVKDTSFTNASAETSGGAIYLATGVDAYFENVEFANNIAVTGEGGALYTLGATVKIDGATFTDNSACETGGAVSMGGTAKVTMNDVTASGNKSGTSGGCIYSEGGNLSVYDGSFVGNSAGIHGGAVAMFDTATSGLYNCEFKENECASNGGAVFMYTEQTETTLHDCIFTNNTAAGYGGAFEASKKSYVNAYNTSASGNTASNGGFAYITSAGTVVKMVGVTVSGNTASVGGPIIWGNTYNADLYIDKAKFTDLDRAGALDSAYWAEAIVNKLTVAEINEGIPSYEPFVPEEEPKVKTPAKKKPVSVNDVLSLGLSSSDEFINNTYDALPRLDNSSNFMSKNVTVFEDINGGDVTVDTFVYPAYSAADNCTVGEGLLIYQAILYKQANPDEEVYIDISSYRFSVQTAVNINRNSRYFGYTRNLTGVEYDKYGFVRVAYLLVTAAKMGIHVTVIGQQEGYPASAADRTLREYFEYHLDDPCDEIYTNGVVGDYMDFQFCYWTLPLKGGTDMMHTKLCAVSDYLDMNGVAHKNAVWTSSSNLDGIRSDAANGNYKLQTATIVSDHEGIYRASVNYLRLVADYCGQEEIYEFQHLVNERSTEQRELIIAGRGNEIPEDEIIVYHGSESDDVFELYFTPFGGGANVWDETHQPYTKYMRKLYNSEDYILFTWNAAEYSGKFPLGIQIEEVLTAAFHKNADPNNRIYGIMNSFDHSVFNDLTVGEDIGFMSFNKRDFGQVHNKDVQYSYVEDGQRYYVSLLNSCNFHSGSMSYQSNFALVIKEKELNEDGVFFTLADLTTTNIVEHAYGEERSVEPSNGEHGYTYLECEECGKIKVTGDIHLKGEWKTDAAPTKEAHGVQHNECTVCGAVCEAREITAGHMPARLVDYAKISGFKLNNTSEVREITETFESGPRTFEATINVPKSISGRVGAIYGNYDGTTADGINLEIYNGGKPRFYYKTKRVGYSIVFDIDIRSDSITHLALTVDGLDAKLYVDGELRGTATLTAEIPSATSGYVIGNDRRGQDIALFKGTIYSVNMFSDVRTPEEIKVDAMIVTKDADNLLASMYFDEEILSFVGDVDGNDVLNVKDLMLIIDAVLNKKELENADVNGDGRLSLIDILIVLKTISG